MPFKISNIAGVLRTLSQTQQSRIRSWYGIQRPRLLCGFVRLIIWIGAVWVVVWPALLISKADWSLDINYVATTVNTAGDFRDFFFIAIVVCVIGLANIFDNIATARRTGNHVGDLSFVAFSILGVIFFGTLFYAIPHFVEIAPAQGALNQAVVNHDSAIIRNILLAGLGTELVIAFRERPAHIGPGSPSG